MTPQKYKLFRNQHTTIFYAATIQQIKSFLKKNGFRELENLKDAVTIADVDELIDYNLMELVQNEHVLEDLIPFSTGAFINKRCPFLAKIPCYAGDRRKKEYHLTVNYFCAWNFCKIKAAQLDREHAILQGCCGMFVDQFNDMLNKAVR